MPLRHTRRRRRSQQTIYTQPLKERFKLKAIRKKEKKKEKKQSNKTNT
jgi:hypothetical protein